MENDGDDVYGNISDFTSEERQSANRPPTNSLLMSFDPNWSPSYHVPAPNSSSNQQPLLSSDSLFQSLNLNVCQIEQPPVSPSVSSLPPTAPAPISCEAPLQVPLATDYEEPLDAPLNLSIESSDGIPYESLSPMTPYGILVERKDSLNSITCREGFDGESIEDLSDEHSLYPPSGSQKSALSSITTMTSKTQCMSAFNVFDQADVVFKGSLNQYDANSIFSCKRRYAVLTASELYLFVNTESRISKQIIPLENIKLVRWLATSNFPEEKKFSLKSKRCGLEFIFSHPDFNESTKWVNNIMVQVMRCAEASHIGGEEPSAVKKGLVKMEGIRQRRYLALLPPYLVYYNTEKEFLAGFPIHRIHVSQLAVKSESNARLLLPTSQRQYLLRFQSDRERDDWQIALTQAYESFYSVRDESIQTRIFLTPANRNCADCGQDDPQWASTAFFITLCEKCAGVHRSFAQFPGRILSLHLDVQRWSEGAKNLLLKIGNSNSNKFWEANLTPGQKISSGSPSSERQRYIVDKYEHKLYAKLQSGDANVLSQQLGEAILENDLMRCVVLYFSGAKFDLCNAYDTALHSGNVDILEFVRCHSGLPMGSSFVSPTASRLNVSETYSVAFSSEECYKLRKCSLNRGVLHVVLDMNASTNSLDHPETERMFTYSQFAFVTYQPLEGMVRLNLMTDEPRFISFRSSAKGVAAKSAEEMHRLSQWALLLCQCFIPKQDWPNNSNNNNSAEQMEVFAGGRMYVCHTAYGEWLESWCMFERSARLHVIHANVCDTMDARAATDIKLSTYQALRLKPTPESGGASCSETLSNTANPTHTVVALSLPDTTLYFAASGHKYNTVNKWYDVLNGHLFTRSFAVNLEECSTHDALESHLLNKDSVPLLVDKCVRYLSVYGIAHEGVYRKSGTQSKILELYSILIQRPREVDIFCDKWTVDEVAGALKKFFRELPEPVLLSSWAESWCHAASLEDREMRVSRYADLVHYLPEINRATVRCLIIHLANVAQRADENKMDAANLSLIFGHLLLRPPPTSAVDPATAIDVGGMEAALPMFGQVYSQVTRDLIEDYVRIFQVTDEELRIQGNIQAGLLRIKQPMQNQAGIMMPVSLRTTLMDRTLLESGSPNAEHEVNVPVVEETTAGDVLNYLLEKKRLTSLEGLALFETLSEREVERPMDLRELVKPVLLRWSAGGGGGGNNKRASGLTPRSGPFVVQNNYIACNWEANADHLRELKKMNHWQVHFSNAEDTKYRERYVHFSYEDQILIITRNPNDTDVVFDLNVAHFQLYHGCEKKRRKSSSTPMPHVTLQPHWANAQTSSSNQLGGKLQGGHVIAFSREEQRLTFWVTYMELVAAVDPNRVPPFQPSRPYSMRMPRSGSEPVLDQDPSASSTVLGPTTTTSITTSVLHRASRILPSRNIFHLFKPSGGSKMV